MFGCGLRKLVDFCYFLDLYSCTSQYEGHKVSMTCAHRARKLVVRFKVFKDDAFPPRSHWCDVSESKYEVPAGLNEAELIRGDQDVVYHGMNLAEAFKLIQSSWTRKVCRSLIV